MVRKAHLVRWCPFRSKHACLGGAGWILVFFLMFAPAVQAGEETADLLKDLWNGAPVSEAAFLSLADDLYRLRTGRYELCTGPEGGPDHSIGALLAGRLEAADSDAAFVTLMDSVVSAENILRVLAHECDAAIVPGALWHYTLDRRNEDPAKPFTTLLALYPSPLLFFCHRSLEIHSLDDLLAQPKDLKIDIGRPGTGSFMIWALLAREQERFAARPVARYGGKTALVQALSQLEGIGCLFRVGAAASAAMRRFDRQAAGDLRLLSVDAEAFAGLKAADGHALFSPFTIRAGTYYTVQSDAPVETVASQALLVMRSDVERSHLDAISAQGSQARQAIRSLVFHR